MINLIRADLYKLFKTKSLYICTLASIMFIILSLFTYQLMYDAVESMPSSEQSTASSQANINNEVDDEGSHDTEISDAQQNDAENNASLQSMLRELSGIYMFKDSFTNAPLFLGILLAMLITPEFSNGTVKNIASRGFSRSKIYLSKFIEGIVANIFLIVITSLCALLAGTIMWEFGTTVDKLNNFTLEAIRMLSLEILANIAVSSIYIMVSFITRKNGPAISINLIIWSLSHALLDLIDLVFEKVFKSDFKVTDYWALEYVSRVSSISLQQDVINRCILVSLGTIIVATAIGIFVFRKRDIN